MGKNEIEFANGIRVLPAWFDVEKFVEEGKR